MTDGSTTRRRAVGPVLLLVGLVALVAAGALVLLRARGNTPPGTDGARGAPAGPRTILPSYVLGIAAGLRELRTGAAGQPPVVVLVLEPQKLLELVVRPEREVPEPVDVRLYWVKDGRARRWHVPLEKAPFTAVRIYGLPERPFGAGEGELAAVVSPAFDLPETPDVATMRQPPAHWKVMWHPIRWP